MTKPFDKDYWDKNYSEPSTMDGIGNVKDHSRYLSAYFNLEGVEVDSLIDFGCGFGHLVGEMLKKFGPIKVTALEPSPFAYKKLLKRIERFHHPDFKAYPLSLQQWFAEQKNLKNVYDLGLCNSVFQYVSDNDLKKVIPLMSKTVRFLYLTVPTNEELSRQVDELGFKDEYAIHRSREFYQKLLRPHFTFISSRVLESKFHFDEKTSPFTDLLFRY